MGTGVVVQGVIRPDGSLEVSEKVPLPPGQVQVTVVPLPEVPKDDPFWQRMQAIWDARRAAGLVPRTEQEIEEERRQTRADWDVRMKDFEGGSAGRVGEKPTGDTGQ